MTRLVIQHPTSYILETQHPIEILRLQIKYNKIPGRISSVFTNNNVFLLQVHKIIGKMREFLGTRMSTHF